MRYDTFCRSRNLLAALLVWAALPALAQPTVLVRNPVRNAPSAVRTTNVTLTFSQNINPATAPGIKVFSAQRGGRKAGAYSTVGPNVTFNPTTDFRPGEKISVTVPSTVRNTPGNLPAFKQVYQFRAAATGGSGAFASSAFTATKSSEVDLADVTGDGRPDVVSYHNASGLVIVRPGNGAGGFGAPVNTAVSPFVSTGGLGDLDGDGDLDLILTVYGNPTDYAQTYYNNGTGTFTPGTSIALTSGTQVFHNEPVIGDIDGDGDLDFLCTTYDAADVTDVRFNNGTGVFSTGPALANGQSFTTSLADMDNDGDLDIVQIEYAPKTYVMRRNNGNGGFGAPVVLGTWAGMSSRLKIADMNGDGIPDLIISQQANNTGLASIEVRLNNGTGVCTLFSSQVTPYNLDSSLEIGDFEGDGDLDVVFSDHDHMQVMLNRGNGSLAQGPVSEINVGLDSYVSLRVADLDGDNDLDVFALANGGPGTSGAILLNQPAITVTAVSPTRNRPAAPRASNATITFSANVKASTASEVRVFGAQAGGRKVGAYNTAPYTITFNPTTDFRPGEAVSVSIPNTITNAAGTQAVKPHVYQFTAAATGGTGTFVPGSNVTASDETYAVALGDLDGDGDLDMVAANSGIASSDAAIRFNNGDGTFGGGTDLPDTYRTLAVVLGDIDGDGDLDLLTGGNGVNNTVRVYRNDGSGGFGAPAILPHKYASGLALGDLDGDGDLDLVAAYNGGDGAVPIYFNDGAGTFTFGDEVAMPTYTFRVALGDIDADGDLDLLATVPNDDIVRVCRNNGAGVFGSSTSVSVGNRPFDVVLGDLDGDGDLDLVTSSASDGNPASVRLNNGAGTFGGVLNLAPTGGGSVALGDVDGDGDLDVCLSEGPANDVRIYRNSGNATFASSLTTAVGTNPYGVALADVDGDGDLDLLAANEGANTVSVRLNQDAFMVTAVSPTRAAANAPRGANVQLTFNKNVNAATANRARIWGAQRGGKKFGLSTTVGNVISFNPTTDFAPGELVNVTVPTTILSTGGDVARHYVYQFRAAATGGEATFTAAPNAADDVSSIRALALADINNDGNQDLLKFSQGGNNVQLYLGTGTGTFGAGVVVSTPQVCLSLATADIDNDGDLDLLVADRTAQTVLVHFNTGGIFGAATAVSVSGAPEVVRVGDVDGDGDLDFITTGLSGSSVRFNNGSGGFSGGSNGGILSANRAALGDVDGDGDLDVVTVKGVAAYVWSNNGFGVFQGSAPIQVGTNPISSDANEVQLGDLDGDGDLDMAVSNAGQGFVAIRLNDGTGQFGGALNVPAGAEGNETALGDFDGDGDLDIVIANRNAASSTLLLNNGDATFAAGTPVTTILPSVLAVGDVDNDGDLDVLASNDDGDFVSVRLNDNAFTVTARAPERHTATTPTFGDVNLTLSEAINPLTASQLRVFGSQSSGRKGGVFAGIGTSLTLDAGVDLTPGELVSVTARATIKSVGNVKSLKPHVYQFRAKATGGSGTFTNAPDVAVPPGPADAHLADVNGDGDLDLLSLDINFDQVGVRLNAGNGTFAAATVTTTGNAPQAMALADVDADGDLDLLVTGTSPNLLSVRFNTGGTFGGGSDAAVADYAVALAVGDVDGDGDLDFVTANAGANTSSIRRNTGAGLFTDGGLVAVGTNPRAVALADIDNDGDLDLLTANEGTGTVSVRRNDGTGTFSGSEEVAVGATPQRLLLADLDGDGDLDLVVANGPANTATLRRNDGTGAFTAGGATLALGAEVSAGTVADVDGDGDLDLLFVLATTNAVLPAFNTGNATFALGTAVAVGAGPAAVTAGDVDGDGDLDFVTADILATTVSVRLNAAVAGPAPTIATFTPDHGVTGTVVTLTGTNFTGATGVTFDGVAAPGFVVNGGGTEITVSSPPATFNGVIAVTTPDGVASTATDFGVDLVIAAAEVIPSGDFHHITVTATGAATLGGNVEATAPVLVQTGGELADGGAALTGAGSFTLEPAATLRLRNAQGLNPAGALQLSGGLTLAVGADYVYQGVAAQVTGTNLPAEVRNLTIDNPTGVTLTQPVNIRQVLTVAGAGNFALNGQALTLLSDAAGTALLVNAGAGQVVGTATVQCWLDPALNAGLGYRHLAVPTQNATVADLATAGFAPVLNAAYNNKAYPVAVKPYPTVFAYDEARFANSPVFEAGYYSLAGLASPLLPMQGYSVYIKGGLTPDFVGTLTQGNTTRPALTRTGNFAGNTQKSGWHLVGNPYASPLDWDLVTVPADLSPSISVFRSTGAGNVGVYLTRANGIGSLPDGIVPLGQAFFARVEGAGPVDLTFTNATRVTTYGSAAHYRAAADPRPRVALTLRAAAASAAETDGATVYFQAGATMGEDRDFDGARPAHNVGLPTLVSETATGTELAVNGLPATALATGTTVELSLDLPTAGAYELAVGQLANLVATDGALLDRLTGTRYALLPTLAVQVAAAQGGMLRGRFALVFGPAAGTVTAHATAPLLPAAALRLWPNPARGTVQVALPAGVTTLALYDATGRVVRTLARQATTIDLRGLPAGVYVARAGGHTQRLVVE